MTDIQAWFDPGCPFSWVTSRWLVAVGEERALDVRWRSFSLLRKDPEGHEAPKWQFTHGLLRVAEAVRAAEGDAPVGRLYTEVGGRIFTDRQSPFPVADALHCIGADPAHAAAAEEPSWDDAIAASMADAYEVAGEDVGTPVLAVGDAGFFGPVLGHVPERDEGLRLWDGLAALADVTCFSELKRPRCRLELP